MQQEPAILYEDEDLIVLEKPSGMTVNKADTTKDQITLQDWIELRHSGKRSNERIQNPFPLQTRTDSGQARMTNKKTDNGEYNPEFEFSNRSGIVHRLDKETSGIILVAKNVETFVGLQKQFKERTTQKSYIALAHGKIAPPSGEISVPVGRLPFNRKRFGVIAGGREATTYYKTLSILEVKTKHGKEQLTLVELYPKTGRTHQIRVHLKYINHPVFSDPLYAGRKVGRDDRKILQRLFLHAASIVFIHPKTQLEMKFTSKLPKDLEQFLFSIQNN